MKVGPTQREGRPWRGKGPGELRARFQLKQLDRVTDSRAEQDPEGVETPRGERRWERRAAAREEESSGG